MKRILSLLTVVVLTLAFAVPASAQTTPHFKFMGIPINGTISSFQNKLAAKGFSYDAERSKAAGPGTRCFIGVFSGYEARLAVFYNTKTKVVYEVNVIIERYDRDAAESLYQDMRSSLLSKYEGRSTFNDDKYEGEDCTTIYVIQNGELIGAIDLYIQSTEYGDSWVAIEYVDNANYKKNKDSKMEDL